MPSYEIWSFSYRIGCLLCLKKPGEPDRDEYSALGPKTPPLSEASLSRYPFLEFGHALSRPKRCLILDSPLFELRVCCFVLFVFDVVGNTFLLGIQPTLVASIPTQFQCCRPQTQTTWRCVAAAAAETRLPTLKTSAVNQMEEQVHVRLKGPMFYCYSYFLHLQSHW